MSTAPDSSSSASPSAIPFANALAGWGDVFKSFMPGAATAANPAMPMPGVGGLPGAQAAMPPGLSHWMTPSANPEELDKRIEDLKTVKFWLDQNATLVDNTIRALEVQRLTMATLKNLNVPMQSMMEAMAAPWATMARAAQPDAAAPAFSPSAAPAPVPAPEPVAEAAAAPTEPAADAAPAVAALPTQWWNDMTGQFARLAQAVVDQGAAAVQATVENTQALVPAAAPKTPRKTAASAAPAAAKVAPKKAAPKAASKAATQATPQAAAKASAKAPAAVKKPAAKKPAAR